MWFFMSQNLGIGLKTLISNNWLMISPRLESLSHCLHGLLHIRDIEAPIIQVAIDRTSG